MDIGKDVLTKTIIGTTDAEKVFTPWWITLHHYLVYTLVVTHISIVAITLYLHRGTHGWIHLLLMSCNHCRLHFGEG